MKIRPEGMNRVILTGETQFERDILKHYGGNWFTAVHGVGGDLIFTIEIPRDKIAAENTEKKLVEAST
jgi:hypothetical protein